MDDDEGQDLLMCTIDQAALAIAKERAHDVDFDSSTQPRNAHRSRVPQDSIDDADDNNFVAEDGQRRPDDSSVDRALTDMVPGALPAIQKRAKDEVDVAAAGIPLEVRRFQCTKSTLALKEATKNDATPQSPKLVDYLVSMTKSSDGLCTEKEMCRWLVAQMCDRLQTGQIWVMAKTSMLLFTLLWRGSNSFVAAVHDYGKTMFDAAYIAKLIRETEQENVFGDRLPCLLRPIVDACAMRTSARGKQKTQPGCIIEMLKQRASDKAANGASVAGAPVQASDIPENHLGFLIANTAYMESLCEYRMRHPTLDVAHGEILCDCTGDDAAAAAQNKRTHSPATWKELLDDTLELMKAIAATGSHGALCPIGVSIATMLLRNAVLLYQVACRALVRLLHSVLTVSHTFVATMQAGLQVPFSGKDSQEPIELSAQTDGDTSHLRKDVLSPLLYDYDLSPGLVLKYISDYYYAIYQFNRTV
ncbi:protein kinase, partial [Lotmaria passim]